MPRRRRLKQRPNLESQIAPEAMIVSGCFGGTKKEIVELTRG
jgi:hypothetical protein